MVQKIIWSPSSLRDLKQISDYISQSSVNTADSTITRIVEAVQMLESFPRMGRKVPEAERDDLREILVFNWRIIYEISEYDVEVLEIVHGAQRSTV